MHLFRPATPQAPPSSLLQSGDYARLITENLPYIEKQCRRAVSRGQGGAEDAGSSWSDGSCCHDNEADELLNEVLDRLKADDFRALREFKGRAKLTTYLTTIVANLVVDLVRQKKGRSRARERAREMGTVAELLYDLVYARGCSLAEAQSHLEHTHSITEPLETLFEMLGRMRGRGRSQLVVAGEGENTWLVPGKLVPAGDGSEIVVVDPRRNAEAALVGREKRKSAGECIAGLIEELSGEERLIIRLRFPSDADEDAKSAKEIGQLLGCTEKSVDAKIRRMLLRFKETLLRQGLSLGDFIES